jgi:hypothetical protein
MKDHLKETEVANALFDKGREAFLGGDLDWDANTIKVVLVDHAVDTPVPSSDQFLSDIASGARIATSAALSSKTKTSGVADAADVVLVAVPGPTTIESIVIYQDTGTAGTSRLIVFIDTANGLPVTSNGGDITITWDNTANRIFKL